MKGWAENSLPTFSKHGGWLRRSVHHCVLVVQCTFSICALTLNVALWAKAMMDSPPGSFPCFKGALGMRRVVVVGDMSGDRSPMSNEELPNGSSTALHQAWWSWSGGCSRRMVKKNKKNCEPDNPSVQLRSHYGIRHTDPPASRSTWIREIFLFFPEREQKLKAESLWLHTEAKTFSSIDYLELKPKVSFLLTDWIRMVKHSNSTSANTFAPKAVPLRLCLYFYTSLIKMSCFYLKHN